MATTVTTKGQVTIPKPVRDRLGIAPGQKVEFQLDRDGRVFLTKAGAEPDRPVSRFAKFRGHATEGLTTDEIMRMTRGDPDDL